MALFKKYEGCRVKMAQNDGYRLCLLQLVECHNTSSCPICHQLTPKAQVGRVAKLKLLYERKPWVPQTPTGKNSLHLIGEQGPI